MRTLLAAAFTFALGATAVAQSLPAFAMNDTNTIVSGSLSSAGFSGQNYLAWQVTPTTSFPVRSAQIFTRNTSLSGDRYYILEIWSDNNGVPGTRQAGGAWKVNTARPFAWQGADLDQIPVLIANTPSWVVWIEVGGSTFPVEPGGASVVTQMRSSNGTTWIANGSAAPKIRLFSGLLDDAYAQPYGQGCPLSTGGLPSVFTNEQPQLGNAGFFFESSGNPNGVPVFMLLGLDGNFVSTPTGLLPLGCFQNTDVFASVFTTSGTGITRGPTCAGYTRVVVALPAVPVFAGTILAAQAIPFDAGATSPLPFVASNALRVTLF